MRVIFLPDLPTFILCFVLWAILQLGVSRLCLLLPLRFFGPENVLFREYKFERGGTFYERVFHVRAWKNYLPDAGMVWNKNGIRKKRLASLKPDHLELFLLESGRAELTHWLAILPFWVFGFFTPPSVIWMMLVYALAVNMPCIIAQRYNRPRVRRLLGLMRG